MGPPSVGPPAVAVIGLPAVDIIGLPAVAVMGLPAVDIIGLPAVDIIGLPAVDIIGLPAVDIIGLPAVDIIGLPAVDIIGLPAVDIIGLPAVDIIGLPPVAVIGLPAVRTTLPLTRRDPQTGHWMEAQGTPTGWITVVPSRGQTHVVTCVVVEAVATVLVLGVAVACPGFMGGRVSGLLLIAHKLLPAVFCNVLGDVVGA